MTAYPCKNLRSGLSTIHQIVYSGMLAFSKKCLEAWLGWAGLWRRRLTVYLKTLRACGPMASLQLFNLGRRCCEAAKFARLMMKRIG